MHNSSDEIFERYLKSFRPVGPEPLAIRIKEHAAGARRQSFLAAFAVACLAAIAIVLIVLPHRTRLPQNEQSAPIPGNAQQTEVSMLALTKLALDDRPAFDTFISNKVRTQFPSMKSEQSTLRILARE